MHRIFALCESNDEAVWWLRLFLLFFLVKAFTRPNQNLQGKRNDLQQKSCQSQSVCLCVCVSVYMCVYVCTCVCGVYVCACVCDYISAYISTNSKFWMDSLQISFARNRWNFASRVVGVESPRASSIYPFPFSSATSTHEENVGKFKTTNWTQRGLRSRFLLKKSPWSSFSELQSCWSFVHEKGMTGSTANPEQLCISERRSNFFVFKMSPCFKFWWLAILLQVGPALFKYALFVIEAYTNCSQNHTHISCVLNCLLIFFLKICQNWGIFALFG